MNQNKEMIEFLQSLPNYELTEVEKGRVLQNISGSIKENQEQHYIRRSFLSMPKLFAAIAIFFIFIIGSALYLSETKQSNGADTIWTVSGKFDLLDKDGSVVFTNGVRGIEGKIGYLDNGLGSFVAGDSRKGAKMFWYVWGNPDELVGKPLKAIATHKETGEQFILNEAILTTGIYGSDAHALTSFNPFPKGGLWKVNIEIDKKLYASIILDVKSPYVKTNGGTILISEEDIYARKELNVEFEMNGHLGFKELPVTVTKLGTNSYSKEIIFTFVDEYVTSENKPITIYKGTLFFEEPGAWSLRGLGSNTTIKVK